MSNLPSPPGSRSLEQLKVVELRDELRKRGLSFKGVKKELLERLEEVIKQEEQDGGIHGEHEEKATKVGAANDQHDSEGEGETLVGEKKEASNIQKNYENQDVVNSPNSLTNLSGLTVGGAIELQAMSVESAPDGVSGVSEDREQCSTAGDLETNNNVPFVDNAVCENGDAGLPSDDVCSNAIRLAKASEPGNGAVGVVADLGCAENYVIVPEKEAPELAANMNVKASHESIFVNVVGASVVTSLESTNPHVTVDHKVDTGSDQSNLEAFEDGPLEIKSVDSQEPEIAASGVCEPREELSTDVAHGPKENDQGEAMSDEEIPDTQLKGIESYGVEVESHRVETGVETSDVKVEQMEIDMGSDENVAQNMVRKPGERLEGSEDTQQQERPSGTTFMKAELDSSDHDITWHRKDCEDVSRVADDLENNVREVTELKLAEDSSQDHNHSKRSSETKQQEPAKRMRRWNSGNQVTVDTPKPLTSGMVKEVTLPENGDGSSPVSQRVTPRVVATSRPFPPKVKVEVEAKSNARTVPPSKRAPSNSLKIERFVRPFTLKAVKDLLAEFGQCKDFWMDQIKTHCFVSFSSVEEGVAARNGLYGRQWPPSVGNCLTADFVDSNEVKIRAEGSSEKLQSAASERIPDPLLAPRRADQPQSSFRSDFTALPTPRFPRGQPFAPVPPEPVGPTLDDLFFKTKEKPHIYYLPLTDEQVAEKIQRENGP